MDDTITTDLGPVTAYADAVKHGYTGTREDFGKLLAGAGKKLEDAVAASNAAETAAENAGNSAQAAADAAGTAVQAASAAETAAGAANTSAGAAAQSASAAATAQEGAENAAKKAADAKTGAENAMKDADAAKDAAGSYADAATESATAAAESATNAASSAKSASDAAQKIEDSAEKISENSEAVSQLKEDKINKPAVPVVGELLRVKSVSDTGEVELETEDISDLKKQISILTTEKVYGVEFSGSTSAGTRTGLAKNFVFTPGTDTVAGTNDFDAVYPWAGMRRCCCTLNSDGTVTVNAYKGQPGYAEDGSNGEVLVEVPKFYVRGMLDVTPPGKYV